MRFFRTLFISVPAFLLLLSAGVYAKSEYARHWTEYADAPGVYWIIAAFATVVLVAFVLWVNFSKRFVRPKAVRRRGYYVMGGIMMLFVLTALGTYLVPPLVQEWGGVPTEDAWNWEPGEVFTEPGSGLGGEPYAGYEIAIAEGCFQGGCHSMFVRPQDIPGGWEGEKPEDISKPGDFYYMKPPLWGTQRNGPDLTLVGRRIPSMEWHIKHLVDPRSLKPESIMPTYSYLSEKQKHDLAAFLVSLGNDPETLKQGIYPGIRETGLSENASRGLKIVQAVGCLGCHTVDGTRGTGPTWKGLYGSSMEMDGTTVVADEKFIYESIVDPNAWVEAEYPVNIMPRDFGMRFSDEEISYIIEYIKSVGDD
jgi:cytochrome c551/c552